MKRQRRSEVDNEESQSLYSGTHVSVVLYPTCDTTTPEHFSNGQVILRCTITNRNNMLLPLISFRVHSGGCLGCALCAVLLYMCLTLINCSVWAFLCTPDHISCHAAQEGEEGGLEGKEGV